MKLKCSVCKTYQNKSQFYSNSNYPARGFKGYTCKTCSVKASEKWKESNRDKIAVYNANYIKNNPDKVKASKLRYYAKNKDKFKVYRRHYYKKNSSKVKLISILYKLKYKEYIKSYDAKYRELHEKSLKNYLKDYYTKNKLAYRDYRAVLNTGMAVKTYRELVEKQNKCCAICKNPEKTKYAKSRQIKHLLVNPAKKGNLVCHTCGNKLKKKLKNSKKGRAEHVNRSNTVHQLR